MLCARNHCSSVLRSHWALEITARACREATWRSKSPHEHAFSCPATLENAAPALLLRAFRSNLRLGRARQPQGAQNHCSGVLRSSLALGTAARASVAGFDNTFVFLAESPFRNRPASNSALLRAVPCATSQSPSGAICESSIYMLNKYIYIYTRSAYGT